MHRRTLNLGILAHVDAGKTTLTERLLFAAGLIDEVGSVDAGTTQTDSLALEQQRGITIKTAVASFPIGDVTVNLVDTPGHPDFIAEVERALSVLDGVVLVVSAVEGVQSQTRVLMRALERLRLPTLIFVNKIDRRGADPPRVLDAIARRLTSGAIGMGFVRDAGVRSAVFAAQVDASRAAEVLAEGDDALLAAYVDGGIPPGRLHDALTAQTKEARIHPVFFGSALTGAGVDALMDAIAQLLPAAGGDRDAPISARVFKVDRGDGGEKIAYARVFAGTIHVRDRVRLGPDGGEGKVTGIAVFEGAAAVRSPSVGAGEIGTLWGLRGARIGDTIGDQGPRAPVHGSFAPPTLESVIAPREPADKTALFVALTELAEQDPLINVRRDDSRQEMSVSLYGEVQKEVIEATLAAEYALEVEFRETTPIHIERPAGSGEAIEALHAPSNPFNASIALRVDPAPEGSRVEFRADVDPRTVPLYLYKTFESFAEHMGGYVGATLREGLFGWEVTDCRVTLTKCTYSVPDGPPSRRGPLSTAADFRKLTPIVLMRALERARTLVCEPVVHATLEIPADAIGAVTAAIARAGAPVGAPSLDGEVAVIETTVSAASADELQRELPRLTRGEGVLESAFGGYQPVSAAEPPTRRRTMPDPLNLDEYMQQASLS